jgi:hypothetical protein
VPRANDLGEAKLKFLLAEFVEDGEIFDVTGWERGCSQPHYRGMYQATAVKANIL